MSHQTNPLRQSNGRCRLLQAGRTGICLVLLVLARNGYAQQVAAPPTPPPTQTSAEPALPDAPNAQSEVAQQTPEGALPGSVHGVVLDRDGSVCQGAKVVLDQAGAGTTPTVRSLISDADGRFNFTDVPAGAFKVTLSAEGFTSQQVSGVLHAGESYEVKTTPFLIAATSSEVNVRASQQEIAQAQLNVEEKQRVLGFIPNFYVSYSPNPLPLTPRQKFHLAWRSLVDPMNFVIVGAFAGIDQADDSFAGYGQGTEGYAKRYGALYTDDVTGTMIGGYMLASILKQDPRYFYQGTGTIKSRTLHALAFTVMCKGDNGHWQVNYSGILGGLAAGGISLLYYPSVNQLPTYRQPRRLSRFIDFQPTNPQMDPSFHRLQNPSPSTNGWTLTFENALIGTAEGAVGNLFQEFVVRKLTPHVPNYGTQSSK